MMSFVLTCISVRDGRYNGVARMGPPGPPGKPGPKGRQYKLQGLAIDYLALTTFIWLD